MITWRESTPFPEPRDAYAAGVIDGRLVLIGGSYWEGTKNNWIQKLYSAATHAFDPKTQRWEKLADAPFNVAYPAFTQVGSEIFVIGGLQNKKPSRDVHFLRKDGGKYVWRSYNRLPEARVFANAVAVGQKIYVVGGTREFEPFDAKGTCCTSHTSTNTLWVLDRTDASRTWNPLSGYPGERRWLHAAVAHGNALYLFGGIHIEAQSTPARRFNEVLRYDILSDQWRRIADMPESMQSAAVVNVEGRIVLIGTARDVMLFDPETARFTPLAPLPREAMVTHFAWIDSQLIGAGGENKEEGPRRRSKWTFIGDVTLTPARAPSANPEK